MKSKVALTAALLAVATTPAVAATTSTTPKKPKSAVSIKASKVTWSVRESFVRYINTGQGTKVSGGAVAEAARVAAGSDAPLVYDFSFPRSGSGWATSKRAVVPGKGGVTFSHQMHGITLVFAKPQIALNGAASSATFTVTGPSGKKATAKVFDLDVTKGVRTAKGKTVTITGIPATIAKDASAMFNGMYPAGDAFGTFTVTYTTK